jgi:hypothetical protein
MKAEYDFSKGKRGAVIPQKGKTRISIFIDNATLAAFRERAEQSGTGYQTMMNDVLRASLANNDQPVTEATLRRILRQELPAYTVGASGTTAAAAPSQSEAMPLIQAFEKQFADPESGALLLWAVLTVDSLHYLSDIDARFGESHKVPGGHNPDIVDVSHVRWATGSCITSLDLCAAALGRTFCNRKGAREFALPDFDAGKNKEAAKLLVALPTTASAWIRDVLADSRYKEVREARNWLTHARVRRHFTLSAGGPPQRLRISVGDVTQEAREIVVGARDLAAEWVSKLISLLPTLKT